MTVDDYAKRAVDCFELADKLSGEDRRRLLEISRAWLRLAEEALASEQAIEIGARPAARQFN